MRIRVPVTETRYGYVDLDVPSDSAILDEKKNQPAKAKSSTRTGKGSDCQRQFGYCLGR